MKTGASILLVEDEAVIAMNEKILLETHGFSVEHVSGAEEAVQACSSSFDIILMDIDLGCGRMDGTEAAQQILENKELPIVFCTSHTEKAMVDKVKGITRYGYVIKDSGEFVLLESINMALELFEAHRKLKEENLERIHAEKQMRWSASLYTQLMENSIDAAYLMTEDGRVLETNKVASGMLGYTEDELIKMTIDDIDINYPSQKFIEFWKGKPEGSTVLFESMHRHKSGELIPVEINGIFFILDKKKYLFGMARNISSRKAAEKELRDNEMLLRKISENYPHSYMSIITADFKVGYTAGQEFSLSGLDPKQFIGHDLQDIFGNHCEFILSEYRKTFAGEKRSFELFFNNQHQLYRTVPLFSEDGSIPQILSIAENINERKKNEDLLKINQERYRKAQEIGNVGNWEYNLQTTEFWGSDQAKRIYGFNTDSDTFSTEAVEKCIPERKRVHRALIDLIEKNKEYNLEFDIITRDTKEKKTIVSLAKLETDANGNPGIVSGVIQDVTEIKKAKENLEKALVQKEILMKELDHRIKNNLMMVSSLIEFTSSDLGDKADLSGLKNQIDAITNTYNSLYQSADLARIDIRNYLENLLVNVFRQNTQSVKVSVECTEKEIGSNTAVFLGLIVNETALNALKHGYTDIQKPEFSVKLKKTGNNQQLALIISNNGSPIPDSVSSNNPGTLGLKLISSIVGQLNGSLAIQKQPNPVFTIYFNC